MTSRKQRALLVDTDPVTRRLCQDLLVRAGFVVLDSAASGVGAISLARESHPAIIFMSEQLTDVPVAEAVKWLRSNPELKATPIIVLGKTDSGNAKPSDGITALPAPITAARIRQALAKALMETRA